MKPAAGAEAYLDLVAQVFDDFSDDDVAAIEAMAPRRPGFLRAAQPAPDDAR